MGNRTGQQQLKQKLREIDHEKIKGKKKTRFRKNKEQLGILEIEYIKFLKSGIEWSYELKCDLAIKLDFTFTQVSKWFWDRRKKDHIDPLVKKPRKQK